MTAVRILSILAAGLLVGAFAIATILSFDLSLADLLTMMDQGLVSRSRDAVATALPPWVWTKVVMALLLRPAWLLPAAVGLICAGAAATVAFGGNTQRTRRKRS